MEAIKLFGFFSVFLVFLFSDINCHGSHDNSHGQSSEKDCPNYGVIVDTSDLHAVMLAQRRLVNLSWASNFIASPSELSKELEMILKQLVNSDSDSFRNLAFVHSLIMTSYLTTLSNDRDLCLFTELINATLALDENSNVTAAAEFLQGFSKVNKEIEDLNIRASLFVAGCKYPKVKPPCPLCYDKGLTYRIRDMWKLRGSLFPCNLRDVVYKMYNSPNEIDRYHALIVTSSLSTVVRELYLSPSSFIGIALERAIIFSYTNIDRCCCKPRRLRLQQLSDEIIPTIQTRIVNIIKDKYIECDE